MQSSRLSRQASRRRHAMFWSIPVLAAALGLSVANRAEAQYGARNPAGTPVESGPARPAAPVTPPSASPASRDVRATELIGMDVRNSKGENVGEIQDLVIDVNNQRVHYAVLAFGGFLGMGDKLFAYPMRLFGRDNERDGLVLDVDREQLREWPGFERSRWPNWNNEGHRSEIEQFHGRSGSASVAIPMRQNMRLLRASELLDRDVNDWRGNDAGGIEDLVVNLRDGSVRYVVMEFDRAWNPNDKLVALPMSSFEFPARKDIDLRLNVDRERLAKAPGFAANRWPDVNDPAWRRRNEAWIGSMGTRERTRDAADAR
ncbi:PRC-barrel domain-containing protein [Caldimonas tepidiphila]|uniref:PRC-barrel domain-containing protein n=1 Tax=Caldimonas tepidiphila TaxID=2315841 RepID=UPI000E5A8716|nr:PRC-barrel domain-containing protein [Caldimonas tepidiphila]